MPSRELRLHPAAVAEIEEARIWYERIDPQLGVRFGSEITRAAREVLDAPDRWPADSKGRRRIRLRVFPHALVYEWRGSIVHILAVAHPSRRPDYWSER
jgi:hypothetical protein